jgi:tetratricopeptide (TPR) repeat protein
MGRLDAALLWLQKTLAVDPKRKEVHGNIADTYYKLGRLAEARGHYDQYLALYPGSRRADDVRRILATLD